MLFHRFPFLTPLCLKAILLFSFQVLAEIETRKGLLLNHENIQYDLVQGHISVKNGQETEVIDSKFDFSFWEEALQDVKVILRTAIDNAETTESKLLHMAYFKTEDASFTKKLLKRILGDDPVPRNAKNPKLTIQPHFADGSRNFEEDGIRVASMNKFKTAYPKFKVSPTFYNSFYLLSEKGQQEDCSDWESITSEKWNDEGYDAAGNIMVHELSYVSQNFPLWNSNLSCLN
jgi:hypothetical protein